MLGLGLAVASVWRCAARQARKRNCSGSPVAGEFERGPGLGCAAGSVRFATHHAPGWHTAQSCGMSSMHCMYQNAIALGCSCWSSAYTYVRRRPLKHLATTFFKLLYRWSYTRAFRHNERLWHGVSIQRDGQGRLAGLSIDGVAPALADVQPVPQHRHALCHLIATGSSVNQIDDDLLDPRNVLGVNGAIALQEKYRIRFDYYCIVDTGFVRNRFDRVRRVLQQNLVLFTTPLVRWYIAQRFALEHMRCRIVLIENVLQPVRQRALSMAELLARRGTGELSGFDPQRALGFSRDIRRGVFDSQTVAYIALRVLAWLGFGAIALHGMDLCEAARTPRFYASLATMQPSALDAHFASAIEPSFRHAAALLRARGIRVSHLSMRSALGADIVEKVDWRSLRGQLGAAAVAPAALPGMACAAVHA
jgi:Kdo-III transferase WaaZ